MRSLFLTTLLALSLGLAQDYSLSIGGQAAPLGAITVNGQIYVPLEALTRAGVTATISGDSLSLSLPGAVTGGAEQLAALEGCIGTDFFNGIWRFKVHALEPFTDDPNQPGWAVEVEVRNGFKETLQPVFTGFSADAERLHLISPEGAPLVMNITDTLNGQGLSYASLPPGGMWKGKLTFHYPFGTPQSEAKQPVKLLVEINPDGVAWGVQGRGVAYSVPDPGFRVDLTCHE
ncbi:MAG: hypothetical protein M3511_06835 [Deinococcota bacterium]|jgi:hypothetical protein|nr:hypothetical protein [Deinococcota bacterium]